MLVHGRDEVCVCGEMGVGGGSRIPSEITVGDIGVLLSLSFLSSIFSSSEEDSTSSSQESAMGALAFFLGFGFGGVVVVVISLETSLLESFPFPFSFSFIDRFWRDDSSSSSGDIVGSCELHCFDAG